MIVFILLYNCGDYYCGCPGGRGDEAAGHIAGVYLSQDSAEKAKAQLEPTNLETWIKVGKAE